MCMSQIIFKSISVSDAIDGNKLAFSNYDIRFKRTSISYELVLGTRIICFRRVIYILFGVFRCRGRIQDEPVRAEIHAAGDRDSPEGNRA